jgi:hypothetical protein
MYAALNLWVSKTSAHYAQTWDGGSTIPLVTEDSHPDWSPLERAQRSRDLAKVDFAQNGMLREYFNEAGDRVAFCPDSQDVGYRDNEVRSAAKISCISEFAQRTAWQYLLNAFLAIIIGLAFAQHRKRPAPTPSDPTS